MIFLIEFNRSAGKIVRFQTFAESDKREAEQIRFGIELDLNRKGIKHDVILLDAESEEGLRRTHRRYFENFKQLTEKKPSLQARLRANGCSVPLAEFQDGLENLHVQLYQAWSVDEMLLHPDDAKHFCDTVRQQSACPGLPDDLILRCLLNRRKNRKEPSPDLIV